MSAEVRLLPSLATALIHVSLLAALQLLLQHLNLPFPGLGAAGYMALLLAGFVIAAVSHHLAAGGTGGALLYPLMMAVAFVIAAQFLGGALEIPTGDMAVAMLAVLATGAVAGVLALRLSRMRGAGRAAAVAEFRSRRVLR